MGRCAQRELSPSEHLPHMAGPDRRLYQRRGGRRDDLRLRQHVRDDAGHENTVITDRYIDIDRQARHKSAKHKPLIPVEPEDGKN